MDFSCTEGYTGEFCNIPLSEDIHNLQLLAKEVDEALKANQAGLAANLIPLYVLGVCALLAGVVAIGCFTAMYKSKVSLSQWQHEVPDC